MYIGLLTLYLFSFDEKCHSTLDSAEKPNTFQNALCPSGNMHKLSAVITQEGDIFVLLCPELDIASQGKTVEEALGNLKEAVELYLEDEDANIPNA